MHHLSFACCLFLTISDFPQSRGLFNTVINVEQQLVNRFRKVCHVFGHHIECREEKIGIHRIVIDLKLKGKDRYQVALDTASSTLWLIDKNYTLWHYDDPENVNITTERVYRYPGDCDLISPDHHQIEFPNITHCPVKYETNEAKDITVLDAKCSNHEAYSYYNLLVIYRVYKEKVRIGHTDFTIPIGGVWKIVNKPEVLNSNEPNLFDGLLGLVPTFNGVTQPPNFLNSVKNYLSSAMFGLFLSETHLSRSGVLTLGKSLDRIDREKLITTKAIDDQGFEQYWAFQPTAIAMQLRQGEEYKMIRLDDGYDVPAILIDSADPQFLLPENMALDFQFFENLGVASSAEVKSCSFWENVNPAFVIYIDDRYIRLTLEDIIDVDSDDSSACRCLIVIHDENYIILGLPLFKTHYVEFHFETEQNRMIKIAKMTDLVG